MTDQDAYEALRGILSGNQPPEDRVIKMKMLLRKMGKTAHASAIRDALEGTFSFNFMMAENPQTDAYDDRRARLVAYSLLTLILQRQPSFPFTL